MLRHAEQQGGWDESETDPQQAVPGSGSRFRVRVPGSGSGLRGAGDLGTQRRPNDEAECPVPVSPRPYNCAVRIALISLLVLHVRPDAIVHAGDRPEELDGSAGPEPAR